MVKVAVTQHEPVWFDLAATVDKTCRLIEEAAKNGAQLVAFPEVWIPGYPMWIWKRPFDPELTTRYIMSSPSYEKSDLDPILAAAKKNKIAVVLGLSENDGDSLYIGQCIISALGEIVMKRRKYKPTHMERTVYGDADGKSLYNVAELEGIGKIGALSCFEHLQPLLKFHTISQREQIHVAAWPPVQNDDGTGFFSITADGVQTLAQTYAMESTSFVLHCTSLLTEKGIDAMDVEGIPLARKAGGGHSAVFAPDGRRITEPIAADKEGMVYADLPLEGILPVRSFVDVVGHYSRPDLLWLGVDGETKKNVRSKTLPTRASLSASDEDDYEKVQA
ncbi:aliphatic nitrilase [Lophiotrema nucula]|uniref:nitrilase n=1 Tax=Lophiotrema nucula TaxID=690887 RepID=A0A6A5ZHS1_9PLEO|nr:aliphatic nitrilase [Lophiotrema nucula]